MTKATKYKEAILIAQEAVGDIEDTHLKITAFKTILEDLLNTKNSFSEKTENASKKFHSSSPAKEKKKIVQASTSAEKLSKSLNISCEELMLIYNVDNNDTYYITCDFGNDVGKSSQIQFVLLDLLANNILNGSKKLHTKEVISHMKSFGFGDLPNLNFNLRSLKPILVNIDLIN